MDHGKPTVEVKPLGVVLGIAVGISYTLVTFGLYGAFRMGASISSLSPIVRFGGLTVASIAGLILWREGFTPRYAAGFAFVLAGLYLLLKR
jgi:drug/metabolite transporter (DMT)-like permease